MFFLNYFLVLFQLLALIFHFDDVLFCSKFSFFSTLNIRLSSMIAHSSMAVQWQSEAKRYQKWAEQWQQYQIAQVCLDIPKLKAFVVISLKRKP